MQPVLSRIEQRGIALIEIILVMTTLIMLTMVFVRTLVGSEDATRISGARARASHIAEEGLEAVRYMRDQDFANLVDGTHGIANVGGTWQFSGLSDGADGYTRMVTVSTIDPDTKLVVSRVVWEQSPERIGSTQIEQRFTNWHAIDTQALGLVLDFSQATLSGDNKEIRNMIFRNTSGTPITITHVKFTWNIVGSNIVRVRIGSVTNWSKNGPGSPTPDQPSGTLLDIEDAVLPPNQDTYMDNIAFDLKMKDSIVTLEIRLIDGSVYTVTHDFTGA